MKYLKPFFEKFESSKLSGVVNYISKSSRSKFLDDLKKICGVLDYPISELSDDKFEYLRFREAYNLQDPVKEIEEGKCQNCEGSGTYKKPWGKEGQKGFHYRNLACKDCDGTGIEKIKSAKPLPKPIYLKFWFNTNGEYIGITRFTDKKVSLVNPVKKTSVKKKKDKLTDWEKSEKSVSYNEIGHLEKVYMKFHDPDGGNNHEWVIGTMFVEDGDRYFISNNPNMDGDPIGFGNGRYEDWTKYGDYCYSLEYGDFDDLVFRLTPKLKSDNPTSVDVPNPDIFNISINSNLSPIGEEAKEFLKDAEFSLVLDLESLKSSNYKKMSNIKTDRMKSRENSLADRKDEDIRKQNIDKYLSKLSSYDPKGDLNQIKTLIPRFFGWSHPTFFLYYNINSQNLSNIINKLFVVFRGEPIENIISEIKAIIVASYLDTSKRYPIVVENIQKCKNLAKSNNREDVSEFISKYENLNRTIISYLGKDITKISDLESVEIKLKNIREILTSERYSLKKARSFLNHLSTPEDSKTCTSYTKISQYLSTDDKDRLMQDMDLINDAISSL